MHSRTTSILLIIAAAGMLLLFYLFDARKGGFPPCPFFKLTGLLCPGCGSQRSLSALLHGEVIEAMQFNPLLVGSLPLLIHAVLVFLKTGGKERPRLLYHPLFAKLILMVVLLFWVARNVVWFYA
jgi:hypothetical protein